MVADFTGEITERALVKFAFEIIARSPEMALGQISVVHQLGGVGIDIWGAWQIGTGGVFGIDYILQYLAGNVVAVRVSGEGAVLDELVAFIIAGPKHNAGMVPQTADHCFGFVADDAAELLIRRKQGAGHHEVLPNQDAEFITAGVEVIVLINAAAPAANGIAAGVVQQVHNSR